MGPVHDAALRIPLVLTRKLDWHSRSQSFDPRSEIIVIGDEHGLSLGQANDKPLVARALSVIAQHSGDDAAATDFHSALMITVRRAKRAAVTVLKPLRGRRDRLPPLGALFEEAMLQGQRIDDGQQTQKRDQLSHCGPQCTPRARADP